MELMILRKRESEISRNEYYAGFNRHEWLSFDGGMDEFNEFLGMIPSQGAWARDPDDRGYLYKIAWIDLATAKAVDKKFGFEGSFVRAYKLRTVKEK